MKLLNRLFQKNAESKYLNQVFAQFGAVQNDDVFLVGYPKSGNTWVRFLIGNYLSDGKCDFGNSHFLVPGLVEHTAICNDLAPVRVMSTHFSYPSFEKFITKFATQKEKINVLFIARDGRDVAVSYYYHLLKNHKIDSQLRFSDFISLFNKGKFNPFQSWGNFIVDWTAQKPKLNFKIVLYKDLVADTRGTLREILEFSRITPDMNRIDEAVRRSDFHEMRRMEQAQSKTHFRFKSTDPNLYFVRSGKRGVWREEFDQNSLDEFYAKNMQGLTTLGYI